MLMPASHHRNEPVDYLVGSLGQKEFSHPPVGIIALADKIASVDQTLDNAADLPLVKLRHIDNFLLRCRHILKQNQQHTPVCQRHAPMTSQQVCRLRI